MIAKEQNQCILRIRCKFCQEILHRCIGFMQQAQILLCLRIFFFIPLKTDIRYKFLIIVATVILHRYSE